MASSSALPRGPLGDTTERSYVGKLELFARFAEPDLRRLFAGFALPAGARVLDLGCGAGLTTAWLAEAARGGIAVGVDLSLPHLRHALTNHALLVQGDAARPGLRDASFEFIWSCNTLNHLADPAGALTRLRRLLRAGGRFAFAQSALLPEMFFAWDAPLDDAVRAACHRAYRERYGLAEDALAGVRGLVGLMRAAGFAGIEVRTHVLERTQPLASADRDYLQRAIFEGAWGEKIVPFLDAATGMRLRRNVDPASPDYCLDRPDFHHIQTLTVCVGVS